MSQLCAKVYIFISRQIEIFRSNFGKLLQRFNKQLYLGRYSVWSYLRFIRIIYKGKNLYMLYVWGVLISLRFLRFENNIDEYYAFSSSISRLIYSFHLTYCALLLPLDGTYYVPSMLLLLIGSGKNMTSTLLDENTVTVFPNVFGGLSQRNLEIFAELPIKYLHRKLLEREVLWIVTLDWLLVTFEKEIGTHLGTQQ